MQGRGPVWGRHHVAGVGEGPGVAWALAVGRQEPRSDGRGQVMAPVCRTGACPLRQGRGKAPTVRLGYGALV
jgi:hypothetical protein